MPTTHQVAAKTIIGIARNFQEFFYGDAGDVTFEYMDNDGNVKTATVPNVAKVKAELEAKAVTDKEMSDALKKYYTSVQVDDIKESILAHFDNYYTKGEINNKVNTINSRINSVEQEADSHLKSAKTNLQQEIDNVDMTKVMSRAEFETLKEANIKLYGRESGVVKYGMYTSRNVTKDLWVRRTYNWPYENSLLMGYPHNGSHHVAEGCSYDYPELMLAGSIFKLKEINWGDDSHGTGARMALPDGIHCQTVTNSEKLPALKHSDFIILKDFTRDLVPYHKNADEMLNHWGKERGNVKKIDNDTIEIRSTAHSDGTFWTISNGNGQSDVRLMPGVEYEISVTITGVGGAGGYCGMWTTGPQHFRINRVGDFKFRFKSKRELERLHFYSKANNEGNFIRIKPSSIKIKQVVEAPIAVARECGPDTDIYMHSDGFVTRDKVSRRDFVFAESWLEDIEGKKVVFEHGLVQNTAENPKYPLVNDGVYKKYATYNLFGDYQKVGDVDFRAYDWDKMSLSQKLEFANNPDNKVFKFKDKWIQERLRIRIVAGIDDGSLLTFNTTIGNLGNHSQYLNYKLVTPQGKSLKPMPYSYRNGNFIYWRKSLNDGIYNVTGTHISQSEINDLHVGYSDGYRAIPIAMVQRRNYGAFHKVYNPEGTAFFAYDDGNGIDLKAWHELPEGYVTSIADCFDPNKVAAYNPANGSVTNLAHIDEHYIPTGKIKSGKSGRDDGYFADAIEPYDVEDLRLQVTTDSKQDLLKYYTDLLESNKFRGKSHKYKITHAWINKQVVVTGDTNTAFHRNLGYVLYVASGTDDYELVKNNGIVKMPYGTIVHIYDKSTNKTLKLICKNNGNKLRRLTTEHQPDNYYGLFKTSGTKTLTVIVNEPTNVVENGIAIHTDIIGDPRKLGERVNIDVTADRQITIEKHMYFKCDNNAHNGGKTGHIYRYLGDKITGVHVNSGDGSANATNGHIDFSDSNKWVDLGDNTNVGGYPDAWVEHGIEGNGLICSERAKCMFPYRYHKTNDWSHTESNYYDGAHMGFKLSRKFNQVLNVRALKKDGTWYNYVPKGWSNESGSETGHSNWAEHNANVILINVDKTYDKLGYANKQEMLDRVIILVTYRTYAECASISESENIGHMLAMSDHVKVSGDVESTNRSSLHLAYSLIKKVPTNIADSYMFFGINRYGYDKNLSINITYSKIKHESVKDLLGITNEVVKYNTVKFTTYLSEEDGRLVMHVLFKELNPGDRKTQFNDNDILEVKSGNGISVTTNTAGIKVLYGAARVELPVLA